MMAGQQYQPNYDFMTNQYAVFSGVYQQCFDYNRSPTTSGSSNTSLNDSRIDPKLSPKYREKRKKNNEAAKKSRATRRQREQETSLENKNLKEKISRYEQEKREMTEQMTLMKTTIENLMAERNDLLTRLSVYEQYPVKPLREINGNQHNQEHTYRNLN